MNYDANKNFENAKAVANLNEPETMRDLYNAAASKFYLERTKLTFEDLEKNGWYANSEWLDWAMDCTGEEWESIDDCIEGAELAADIAIEREAEERVKGLHVEYIYSPRDTAAVGYAHGNAYSHVADNEDMSTWDTQHASDFLDRVKNDDQTIWDDLDAGIFPGISKHDGNADADGIGTAWIRIVDEDGETVAESSRVIYPAE